MTNETITTSPLATGIWTLDPYHSAVGFTVRHLGVSKVRGRFARFTSELSVGETGSDITVDADIELASIDTGNPQRDDHVRSADLLDVAARPSMVFRSTKISGDGENWSMTGDLTIGGVSRPVVLDVEFGGVQKAMDGKLRAGFEALGEIRRSDFGLAFGTGLLSDVVKITLDMQFVEPV
jgi:polyisoprenoid-binding protein YceI